MVPVVSPALLYTLTRAAFGSNEAAGSVPGSTRKRLAAVFDPIHDVAFGADVSVVPRADLMLAALETVGSSTDNLGAFEGRQEELVVRCTRDIVRCCAEDLGGCLPKWRSKHIPLIRASARVLQCMAYHPSKEVPGAADLSRKPEFREALEAMLRRQEHLLGSGGTQARAARAAHLAIGSLYPKAVLGKKMPAQQGGKAGQVAGRGTNGKRAAAGGGDGGFLTFVLVLLLMFGATAAAAYLLFQQQTPAKQREVRLRALEIKMPSSGCRSSIPPPPQILQHIDAHVTKGRAMLNQAMRDLEPHLASLRHTAASLLEEVRAGVGKVMAEAKQHLNKH